MSTIFLHTFYNNLLSTAIAILILSLIYVLSSIFIARRFEHHRKRKQFSVRVFYVICVVFLFVMAKIWVDGFTHLLAVLGLVSAGLVIANKETIMNLSGFFIIMWRGLFAEGDLIEIIHYKGYVRNVGVLYFSLLEVSEESSNSLTGRVVRVPNGSVANNPLINFSQGTHLLEQILSIIIKQDSDIHQAKALLKNTVEQVLADFYKNRKEYSVPASKKKDLKLAGEIQLKTVIAIKPKLDAPSGVELSAHYYCFVQDQEEIKEMIWEKLLAQLKQEPKVHLAYE